MKKGIKNTISAIAVLMTLAIAQGAFAGDQQETDSPVVNINTASETQLSYLPGVGESTAKRIMDYRKKSPFQKPFQIMRVRGIGKKTFRKMRDYLTLKGDTTATSRIRVPKS